MMYQQIFISALLALCLPEVGFAAPDPEVRSESVCTNGIYAELSPALAGYSVALASCSAIYPVECTPDLTELGAMLAETKIAPQQQEAAWSKLQQQPNSVVSTMCSCIATPKNRRKTSNQGNHKQVTEDYHQINYKGHHHQVNHDHQTNYKCHSRKYKGAHDDQANHSYHQIDYEGDYHQIT
ncbi:hypothetical protein LTR44_007087 [Exophiala sp. CCFEE 6388]|uniref:Uncharacterized protein n=1 Tax=Exophiala sideris TaxID=1016849 RepID=A0ABR0JKK4_9EURO|nr:hypothetical protein LTR69_001854 [Exophiala sideris]KAK5180330.1 hypothetical protein LTR44_007087 [Eurotiomycetes sp. CCFEE 6388]